MAQNRTRRAETIADRRDQDKQIRNRRVSIGVGVLLVVLIAGWLGWGLKGASLPDYPVKVIGSFTGTVVKVDLTNQAGCIQPDSGGRKVCSNLAPNGITSIQEGSHVRVAHETFLTGRGKDTEDMLVVYALDH